MKKNINKKVLGIVATVVIIAAIIGMLYIKNQPNKLQTNTAITATVRKASFGSVINVTLSDEGKKQYKGAVKYRVYYEGKPITQKIEIGKPTTAYPARKENDKVTIKLLKADNKEAYSVNLNLQKESIGKKK